MKVFLSYASPHKDLARPVCTTLRAAGYDVFFDETDLPPGEVYDDRIREAVQASDLFILLLSPEAVTPGRYTLTELGHASARWPNPLGHVLTVLPLDTDEPPLPDYLRPLTMQKQAGNLAAEVLTTVRRMTAPAPAAPAMAEDVDGERPGASYQSLDLRLQRGDGPGYRLTMSGAAELDATALPGDADPAALESALWAGALAVAGVSRRGQAAADGAWQLPSPQAAREVGQRLHEWLFQPALRERLKEPLRRIDRQQGRGLRFVINTTDAPTLARLPWEFAYDAARQDFIFADPMKPVVRWLDVDEVLPTLRVQPPLRLLIAVAAPTDRAALAVGDELAQLDQALGDLAARGAVTMQRLDHTSVSTLNEALSAFRPHVLHFIGHGDFDGDEGSVLLEADDRTGRAAPVSGRRLAMLLRNHLQHSLRLVFLNSCMGAAASGRDPFGGVAQALVGHGVPAVIAMQFPIPDHTATELAQQFYANLAAGRPVDEALTAARSFLYVQGHEVEWGAPVLTLRAPDGRLFDVAPARAAAAAPSRPMAEAEAPRTAAPPGRGLGSGLGWGLAAIIALLAAATLWWTLQSDQSAPPPPDPSPIVLPPPIPTPPVIAPTPAPDTVAEALARAEAAPPGDERVAALASVESALWTRSIGALGPALPTDQRQRTIRLLDEIGASGSAAERQRAADIARALGDEPLATRLRRPAAGGGRPPTGVATPDHVVRRGDTLWSIARLRYGDARRWPDIAEANRAQLPDPSRIEPSQRLRIPPHPSALSPSELTVREGDSLWRLAARLYGDGRLWPRLWQANRDRLADPQQLRPGLTLTVPPARR